MELKLSKKNIIENIEYILREYYSLNYEPLLSVLTEDCVWIHPSKFIIMGAEAIKRVCDDSCGIPVLLLENMKFELLDSGAPNQIAICGSYFIYSDLQAETDFYEKQRITLLLRLEQGSFKIYHMHASNECVCRPDAQKCPVQISRQTYFYMQKILQENPSFAKCHMACRIAVETDGGAQYIDPEMVQYVEAMGKTSIVYMLDRTMVINKPFSLLEKMFPSCFYRIHRSYLVNCNYVVELKRYSVTLLSGAKLPVPAKRYAEIKEKVFGLMQEK